MKSTQAFQTSSSPRNHGKSATHLKELETNSRRHIFFALEEKEEEVESNVDQFKDSYTRDITVDELSDVRTPAPLYHTEHTNHAQLLKQMSKSNPEPPDTSETIQTLDAYIQERVNSGHELPIGYLFKGLTLFFPHKTSNEADPANTDSSGMERQYRLRMASNTASFAGATVVSSLDDPAITHVVVDPKCAAEEISSIRGSWAAGSRKLPHLVSVEWVEECWAQRTVLDEERMSPFPLFICFCCVGHAED